MESLKNRIKAFNETMDRLFEEPDSDWDSYERIKQMDIADAEQLNKFQTYFDTEIPAELTAFYQQLGGLKNYTPDGDLIEILSVSELLEELNDKYEKRYSMGLIDGIKHLWNNDLPEFDDIPKSEIDYINTNYKCIGFYCLERKWVQAFYIYFDKDHRFGSVYYNLEEFDELRDKHLTPMLTKSQADKSLEQMLIQIIDNLEEWYHRNMEDNQ